MTTEEKALALLGEVSPYKCEKVDHAHHAYLCAALRLSVERHEAAEHELADCKQELADFKQKVSDTVGDTLFMVETHCDGEAVALVSNRLLQFIIPAPKPDPLVDVWKQQYPDDPLPEASCNNLYAALDALGFEIKEKSK